MALIEADTASLVTPQASSPSSVRASIVIRALNEGRHLPAVLRALEHQSIRSDDCETILVDSGSTDATLKEAADAGCRILHIKKEEFTFGRSLNRGCHAAQGRILVFLSGHCVPKDDRWLENLIVPLELGEAEITYGRQIGGQETKFSEHQVFAKYYPQNGQFDGIPFFCNNANAAVTRSLWERLRFAEELTGLEDMDFARRAGKIAGARVQYRPGAIVYHHHSESWGQVKRRYEREAYALQHIMPELQFTAIDALRCFLSGMIADARAIQPPRRDFTLLYQAALFRFCQFYGAWVGHHTHREISRQRKLRYFYPK